MTGASSGIGREIAIQLVSQGAHVLATARRENRLIELQNLIRKEGSSKTGSIEVLAGDLTDADHRKCLAHWVERHWKSIDVVVNNAGNGAIGRFAEASEDRLRKIMEVNFFAAAELTRMMLPLLKHGRQPAIVNIGSVLAWRGVPRKSEYCAAKFALRGWSEALRVELQSDGIDVLQIHPSTTSSEFFEVLTDSPATEKSKSVGSMRPDVVARSIVRAIERNRREVILSPGGRVLVWASNRFPNVIDWVLKRYG